MLSNRKTMKTCQIINSSLMSAAAFFFAATTPAANAQSSESVPSNQGQSLPSKSSEGFLTRLSNAFGEEFNSPAFSPAPPGTPASSSARRIGPQPFDSPPYPTGDSQIAGAPNSITD